MPDQPVYASGRPTNAEQILDAVKIPSLPEAAVKLLTLCRDVHVGAGEIVSVVELDAALSARLLRVANSAAFGQGGKVATLTRAAVVLGNENLKVVSLGFYLSGGWDKMGYTGLDLREFWRDSVLRACLARRIAKEVSFHPAEQAFLVGMVQDIGTLILGTYFGLDYADVIGECRGDNLRRQAEENSRFGTDHAEVAAVLARRWNFPEMLTTALGRQCTPPPMTRVTDASELLWQIAYFGAVVPFSHDRQTARIGMQLRNLSYSGLGLTFESLSEVFTDTVEQFNALRGVFAHLIPKQFEAETIMQEAAAVIQSFDTAIDEG